MILFLDWLEVGRTVCGAIYRGEGGTGARKLSDDF